MLITFGERSSESPLISRIWRAESCRDGEFLSVAYPQWEIVISRIGDKLGAVLRGPETIATKAYVPSGGSWIGLRFRSGSYLRGLNYTSICNAAITLPVVGKNRFWLAGMEWEAPTFENADDFVARLTQHSFLETDPVVIAAMMSGPDNDKSLRTQQRHFTKFTGLTKQAVHSIERAQLAALMLREGFTINDTLVATDFTDQSHLTRSLTRYIGLTPGQLSLRRNDVQLSFIPKAPPFLA